MGAHQGAEEEGCHVAQVELLPRWLRKIKAQLGGKVVR